MNLTVALLLAATACSPLTDLEIDAQAEDVDADHETFDPHRCEGSELFFSLEDPVLREAGLLPLEGLDDAAESMPLDDHGNRIGYLFDGTQLPLSAADEHAIAVAEKTYELDGLTLEIADSTTRLEVVLSRIVAQWYTLHSAPVMLGRPSAAVEDPITKDGRAQVELLVHDAIRRHVRSTIPAEPDFARIRELDLDVHPAGVLAHADMPLVPMVTRRALTMPSTPRAISPEAKMLQLEQRRALAELQDAYRKLEEAAVQLPRAANDRKRLLERFARELDSHLDRLPAAHRLSAFARAVPIAELVAGRALAIATKTSGQCAEHFRAIASKWTARVIELHLLRQRIDRLVGRPY